MTMPTNMQENANATRQEWRGYDIDELRYHRAVALVKLEMQRARLAESAQSVTGAVVAMRDNLSGKRFSGRLKFLNYIVIGYKSMRTVVGLWNTFKRKRQ